MSGESGQAAGAAGVCPSQTCSHMGKTSACKSCGKAQHDTMEITLQHYSDFGFGGQFISNGGRTDRRTSTTNPNTDCLHPAAQKPSPAAGGLWVAYHTTSNCSHCLSSAQTPLQQTGHRILGRREFQICFNIRTSF